MSDIGIIQKLLERGLIPDRLIRFGIRRLLQQRLQEETESNAEAQLERKKKLIAELKQSPLAIETDKANEQHYEVPAEFFRLVLGVNRKYSCAYYELDNLLDDLDHAEERMLNLTCERAQIQDGDRILELGCGWGSLTLHMAKKYPRSSIVGVSNSRSQRTAILERAAKLGLNNVEIITADINHLTLGGHQPFDRAVSVEMFEHVRNYQTLLSRLSGWLKPSATLFIHIFTHHSLCYPFEVRDASDWMAKYFFSGGLMPSDDLMLYFQEDFKLLDHWRVDGRHYERTSNDWLRNMDQNRAQIEPTLATTYGPDAGIWWHRWRVFFMACAELWGYRGGQEWLVTHQLFQNRRRD